MMQDPASITPRALLVDLSLQFGGASVRAANLVRGAGENQWALAVLQDSPAWRHAQELGLKTFVVGSRRIDPGIISRLAKVIRDGDYQLVDGQNPQSKLWGALAAWRTQTAFISTLNSWPRSEYGASLRGSAYTALERLVRMRTHLHIAVSNQIQEQLLDDGVPPSRIVHIPAAVDLNPETIAYDPAETRRRLGLSPDERLCIAVGRLAGAKGYPYLLAAMQHLSDRFPDLHCLIVGDGALRPSLQMDLEQLGLTRRVHLLGFRPREETLTLVLSSDLFVMPSLTEGTPVALLEAAALARPIVASAVGGIPSMFADGEHARLVRPADAEHLAAAIAALLDDPEHARDMAECAMQRVRQRYGLAAQVRKTQDAYRQALHNQRIATGLDQE